MRPWSVWDELPVAYPDLDREPLVRITETAELRCRRRTQCMTDNSADIGAEIESRMRAWREFLKESHTGAGPLARVIFAPAFAVSVMLLATFRATAVWLLPIVAALIVTAAVRWTREQRERRLFRTIMQRRCPNCRYPLAGLNPAELRACPECGEPWPLVPPPAELAK